MIHAALLCTDQLRVHSVELYIQWSFEKHALACNASALVHRKTACLLNVSQIELDFVKTLGIDAECLESALAMEREREREREKERDNRLKTLGIDSESLW